MLAIGAVLVAVLPALAQTPTVDELLARNLESRGGAEKLKAISTRKVTGKVTVHVALPPGAPQQAEGDPKTLEMPIEVWAKRPNLMKQEMRMQDQRIVTAFDGQQAWAIIPGVGSSPQLVQGVQADLIRDQAQFDGPLAYARQRGLHQSDASVVWDLGPHDFSILAYWLDESPVGVTALSRGCVMPDTPDVAFIQLEYGSGVIAHVELAWLAPSKLRRTTVVGSRKMVVYDDTSGEPVRVFDSGVTIRDPDSFGEFQLSYRTGDILSPKVAVTEPLE